MAKIKLPSSKIVDAHLPKWLSSKILSAVDYVWQVKQHDGEEEESKRRIKHLAKLLDGEELCWVMMLLTLPKLNAMIMQGEEYKKFADMRRTIN